jgi:hypothetical protein
MFHPKKNFRAASTTTKTTRFSSQRTRSSIQADEGRPTITKPGPAPYRAFVHSGSCEPGPCEAVTHPGSSSGDQERQATASVVGLS